MEINVSKGQGITQAIAANLGLDKNDCKKVKLSTWQSIMTLVDEANTKSLNNNGQAIFTGGNDVKSIGNKSSWKSNFHVNPGDVMHIEDSIYDKIKQLLGVKVESAPNKENIAGADIPAESASSAAKSSESSVAVKSSADEKTDETKSAQQPQQPAKAEQTETSEQTAPVQPVQSEKVKKGESINQKFAEMSNFDENGKIKDISLNITGDDWRKLAGKKDKTDAEKKQLDTEYKSSVKDTGAAYTAFLDTEYGNGDGVLNKDEYYAYEDASVPDELRDDDESMAQIKEMSEIGFNHLDLNKDGVIDKEEIASYIHAMDFGTEEGKSNGLNGKISAYDFMVNSLALSKAETSMLDKKLAYAYKALFGKKAA